MTLRNSAPNFNPALCLFCQSSTNRKEMHTLETFNTSQKILEHSKFDKHLKVALANCQDLIAFGGKYHLYCYVKIFRNINKSDINNDPVYTIFHWLSQELKLSANKGHVIRLKEVWERFCLLSS